jgi:hypothetical protein
VRFTVVSTHEELREDGRPLQPGEEITLAKDVYESDHYNRMVEDGVLVPTEQLQREQRQQDDAESPTEQDEQDTSTSTTTEEAQ